ncbi:hypothetical protein FRB99_004261 [Tulasnella sp. 403]|nr:hypothetical protein FRB99_004261 [Tulasnella sp. 403]
MDASASNDPQPSTSSSRSPFNTVRSAFEALSAATAPSVSQLIQNCMLAQKAYISDRSWALQPRPKKTRGPSALEILTDHYGLADPPELHYNAPPPAYDDLFGSSKSFSKVDALKTIAKRVGRELTGGSKS